MLAACGPVGPRSGLTAAGPNGFDARPVRGAGMDPALMDAPSVQGTLWVGATGDCAPSVYRFDEAGALHIEHDGGARDEGSWKQTGAYLWASIPTRQTEFQGVVDGDRISGVWTTTNTGTKSSWLGARRGSASEATPTGYACTTWRGVISDTSWSENVAFHFRGDGVLHWQDMFGYHENGTWGLDDAGVQFQVGTATYRGQLEGGDRLAGTAWHGSGDKWSWSVVHEAPNRTADVELAGTTWVGWRVGAGAAVTLEFQAGGVLRATVGTADYTGSWEVDGTLLHATARNSGHEFELWGGLHDGKLIGNGSSPSETDQDGRRLWFEWEAAPQGAPAAPRVEALATIEGTIWDGELGDESVVLRFEKEGRLVIEPAGKKSVVAVWQQSGDTIFLSISAWDVSYQGVVADDKIEGHGWNDRGDKSTLRLSRR